MAAFDLAEGVIKLTADLDKFQEGLDQADAAHAKLEEKLTARTAVESKRRADGWVSASEGAASRIAAMFAKPKPPLPPMPTPVEAWRKQEADRKEEREGVYAQDAIRHGKAVADYIESKREQKETRRNQKLVDAFRFGPVGGRIAGGLRSFKEGVDAARPAALSGVAAGAGAMGLAGAASPLAANTLTESLSLAAAKIGKDFVPAMVELAFTVQRVADWWEQLDKGLKSNIVQVTKFVAVAGAATLAIGAITKIAGTLAMLIKAHPILAGIAIAGGVGTALNETLKGGDLGKDARVIEALEKMRQREKAGEKIPVIDLKGRGIRELPPRKDEPMKLGTMGPSSFSSLQDFYRKVLLDTTGGSELEAEQLKIQSETRDGVVELVKIARTKKGNVVD